MKYHMAPQARKLLRLLLLVLVAAVSLKSIAGPGRAVASVADSEDQIVLSQATPADAAVAVLDARRRGGSCLNDALFQGSGPFAVGDLITPGGCASELTVFARGRALLRINPSWSDGVDTVVAPRGPSLRRVEVDVYVVSSGMNSANWARLDLVRAGTLFDDSRVGLSFDSSKFVTSTSLTNADKATIGDNCQQADALKGSSLYNPNRINVYVIPSITSEGLNTWRGYNCWEKKPPGNPDGTPNIIYISVSWHSPTTLAHELGHALGLRGKVGHTGGPDSRMDGFESTNLMWKGLDGDGTKAQDWFSLGQAFRMNADTHSWLNRAAGSSSTGPQPLACSPTSPKSKTPCPPLAFDLPAGN
jgi:hypothetical protein